MWDDNWFDESDTAYIGRTAAYYAEDEDEDGLYVPDYGLIVESLNVRILLARSIS